MSEIAPVEKRGIEHSSAKGISQLLGVASAVVMAGAGVYLLTSESASADATVFDVLMHGIGAYFIARGLWVLSSLIHRP